MLRGVALGRALLSRGQNWLAFIVASTPDLSASGERRERLQAARTERHPIDCGPILPLAKPLYCRLAPRDSLPAHLAQRRQCGQGVQQASVLQTGTALSRAAAGR